MSWRNTRAARGAALLAAAALSPLRGAQEGGGSRPAPAGPPPAMVRLGEVRLEKLSERRFVTGEVMATRRSRIAGREAGLVVALPVREGQAVAEGEVLARIDESLLRLDRAQLEADRGVTAATLAERQADLALAEWQEEAMRELSRRGSGYELELRQAAAAVAAARARCQQAEGDLAVLDARGALLDQRIADTVIQAPFGGVVITRLAEEGEWLAAGGAVVELISAGDLEAWFELPESLAAAIQQAGQEIELQFGTAEQQRLVREFRLVPQVDPRTRTFPLVVPLRDPAGLTAGMSARAWIPSDSAAEHLTVPRDALLRGEVGHHVFVARREGADQPLRAVPVPVERLFSHGERVAVRAALLLPGDQVVVEGNERLQPLMPVQPLAAEEP